MKILLDLNPLTWALNDPERLNTGVKDLLSDASNLVYVSAATIWEWQLDEAELSFPDSLERLWSDYQFLPLPITPEHSQNWKSLPLKGLSFETGILATQAHHEGLTLITDRAPLLELPIQTMSAKS